MSAHNYGPWKMSPADAVDVSMWEIYAANNSVVARRISNPDDAHLISAAPELLQALKCVRDERLVPGSALYKMVSKVIDKAQGVVR